MKKKKVITIITTVAVIGVLGGTGYYYRDKIADSLPFVGNSKTEDKVYVEKLSKVMNTYTGVSNRYNGVVEAQESYEVSVDSGRTVKEVLVKVGDTVEEGQTLLTYDISDVEVKIKQANLELESINNEIENYNKQLGMLREEYNRLTDEDEKFAFATDIQSMENSIEQSRIDYESQKLEIDKLKDETQDSGVVSKKAGVVKEINESGMDGNGNNAPFMTIMQTGEYRVKGSIDEQNVWMVAAGQEVVIRSRVDESKTWTGTVSKLDTENVQDKNNDNYYMGGNSESVSATKYPFYIELESAEGLLLGQHVFIELDEGQEEPKEGIWLYADYVVQEEDTAYVWVANAKNRLEKRLVELGEFDENLSEYQIKAGLEENDYIAWPMPGFYEGITTVTDAAEVDYSSPLYNQESTEMFNDADMMDMMEGTEWMDTDMNMEETYSTEWVDEPMEKVQEGGTEVLDLGTEVAE